MELLELIKEYSKKCSENNEPGHDFNHILRVRKLALEIASHYEVDRMLLESLVYLHDIEDKKLNKGESVLLFLDSVNAPSDLKEKILNTLPYLSFSKYKYLPDEVLLEGKIVSDADRIDAIGAIGIARAFSYGGSHNRSFSDTLEHFDEKLLILDKCLSLVESKQIAKKRMIVLQDFYDEFKKENEL